MIDLIDRLLEPDWHDPACPFLKHCYCDDGAPHDAVRHPLAREAADEITALRARVEAMEGALEVGMDQLHWINAQAENAMATAAGAATASGDSDGSLQMLNSIASDIGINAMMLHDKLNAARHALKDTPDAE